MKRLKIFALESGKSQSGAGAVFSKRRTRHLGIILAIFFCTGTLLACLGNFLPVSGAPQGEFRGVWVATVASLNYPSQQTTDPEVLKADAVRILDNAKNMGFNAVFFQVRPASDALYKSEIFPWSRYLTGTQGIAPDNGFDPLAFMIAEAHARGLELHAWLNPYRITNDAKDNNNLAANHPARQNPAWVVTYSDGKMYWNPGEPGVQQLIADGVREIVDNYDVDGIHIDDYFYPGADFDDSVAYSIYGTGFNSLAEWRLNNTETTVKNMYNIVKSSGKSIIFGVSPIGIWANKSTSTLGSNTNGGEAYTQKYADTRGWVKRGIVDYIAPQIYWNIGFDRADYITLVDWWSDVVAGTGVKLYIGQAAYRTGDTDSSSPWYGVSEIRRQVDYSRSKAEVAGYIMYSYKSVVDSPELTALIKELNSSVVSSSAPAPVEASVADNDTAADLPANPIVDPQADPTADPPADGVTVPSSVLESNKPVFGDITGHWAAEFIAIMAEKGVIQGDPAGNVLPNNPIKRADFVLMLTRMLGIETTGAADNFADVPENAYYAKALAAAKSQGLVSGMGDNYFAPDNPITRQDMFTITYRALHKLDMITNEVKPGVLNVFTDRGLISDYALTAVSVFVDMGIVKGIDGKIEPFKTATRAETATILYMIDVKV